MKRITIFENNLIKLDMYVALLMLVNMYCSLPTYTVGNTYCNDQSESVPDDP